MKSTFKLLFYIKRCELKRDGTAPIMGRITINGIAKQFTCHLFIYPELWDTKAWRALGNSDESRAVNYELAIIRKEITKHYWKIRHGIGPLTAERVKAAYFGENMECRTLLQVFAQHNETIIKQVDNKLRSKSTLHKYRNVYRLLEEFLATKYRSKDIALIDLRINFITEFELFLRNKKRCSTNTVWMYLMPLKRMVAIARDNGWLDLNPFSTHHVSPQRTERNYLTTKELGILIDATFKKRMYGVIKDMFLFCSFTGVTYVDLARLAKTSVQKSEDGKWWLTYRRQKTGLTCSLPLLEIPMKIIQKYKGMATDGRLFPVPCYATLMDGIKKVIKECGINKHVTWHCARHTYASEICLLNGVPIETISKMLGHTDIKTTQIYAKLSDTAVGRDMEALSKRLAGINEFASVQI